ncbi:phosphopyruvate hydratase, partial [Candidatus Woesearchaeota archaeon]|nr:phosphopyruvate hydratase [Candidatus Woesearchaeota archaeon]
MHIKEIIARKILDSRGNPTIEIEVDGCRGSAPSGASTGTNEATTFPHGVEDALRFAKTVLPEKLKGIELTNCDSLKQVDEVLHKIDPSEKWVKIGGSVVVELEFALLHAMAKEAKKPLWKFLGGGKKLPRPLGNCVGGGAHAGIHAPDIQEFLLLGLEAKTFSQALFANAEIHRRMKVILADKDSNFTGGKTDEGAWTPTLTNLEILDHLHDAVKKFNEHDKSNIKLGMDMAASEFFKDGRYHYKKFSPVAKEKILSREEQIGFVVDLIEKYGLNYIEDPLEENDFEGFAEINERTNCFICGDDLTTTNPERLKQAIELKSITAVIVKPNQVGSLIKTKEVIDIALKNQIVPVISHRSGETDDDTIAHLGIAFDCPIIKCGIVGGERLVKLNEILRI